jgi:hypothetical protein
LSIPGNTQLLTDLLTAGLQPELVARVAEACAESYARGLIDAQPQRTKAAERQARYRDRHTVTQTSQSVTERNGASQRDVSFSPAPPFSKIDNKKTSMRDSKRGTRIPDDWQPSHDDAKAEGLTDTDIAQETARFRDYWKGRAGGGGVKLDWPATWRNWCRTAAEKRGRGRPTPTSGPQMVFVLAEDPAFAAWDAYHGKKNPKNRNGGWHFPSKWPPGYEPKEAAE